MTLSVCFFQVVALYYHARTALNKRYWETLSKSTRLVYHHTFGMVLLQVGLGISTLLSYVPVSLGVAHQLGALTLLMFITALVHSLRVSRYHSKQTMKVASVLNSIVAKTFTRSSSRVSRS